MPIVALAPNHALSLARCFPWVRRLGTPRSTLRSLPDRLSLSNTVDSIPGPVLWQNGPWLNGTLGRDWPELGAKAEPKATKDPSVRPDKIQIALSIYHSILAQVQRCARPV